MPPPCGSPPPQHSAQAEESHPSRTHRCCGMPAPSLLSARASPQQESQTSSEDPLKGMRGEDGKRKLSEEQRGGWFGPPGCHLLVMLPWDRGGSGGPRPAAPTRRLGYDRAQPPHPAAWGSWPRCPSPSGSGSCPRRRPRTCPPASGSPPPCRSRRAVTRGERRQRGVTSPPHGCAVLAPHISTTTMCLAAHWLGLRAQIHVSNPKKRWAKGRYEVCPLSWAGSAPYHALAPDTDAVGVPVAAPGTVVNNLVHEHHVPRPLGLADQLALLGIWGKTQGTGRKKNEKCLLRCIRLGENRNPSQLVPVSTARLQKEMSGTWLLDTG